MKLKTLFLTLSLVAISTLCACAQNRVFESIPAGKGIQKVYVGPAMMKMLGSKAISSVGTNDFNMSDVLKGSTITSVEVLNCEEGANIKDIKRRCNQIINTLKLQVLVENSEDGENGTTIYGVPDTQNPDILTKVLIYNVEDDEINCVVLTGKIDFNQTIQNSMND